MLGEAQLQIPFEALGVLIYVVFLVLDQDIPSLLSNKYTIYSGLYISLQVLYINVIHQRQPLTLLIYFFLYRWTAYLTPFSLYTERDLSCVHRGFSVKDTERLLKNQAVVP